MTTTTVIYPTKALSSKARRVFLYRDQKGTEKWKSRSVRVKYPLGSKSARVAFVDDGKSVLVNMSLFRAIAGQNALTLPDVRKAVAKAFDVVTKRLHEEFHCEPLRVDIRRNIRLRSIDLVRHYRVGSARDVSAFLMALYRRVSKRSGKGIVMPVFRGGICETVQIEIPELHLKVKFYDKYRELQQPKHRLPRNLPDRDQLLETTKGCLRMEVTLSTEALQERGLDEVKKWKKGTRNLIFNDVFAALRLIGRFQVFVPDGLLKQLSSSLKSTYLRWRFGDTFDGIAKSTLARHKKKLWDDFRIDIGQPPGVAKSEFMRIKDVFTSERLIRPTPEQIKKWVPRWLD